MSEGRVEYLKPGYQLIQGEFEIFVWSQYPERMVRVMAVSSRDIELNARDLLFFKDFVFVCNDKRQ